MSVTQLVFFFQTTLWFVGRVIIAPFFPQSITGSDPFLFGSRTVSLWLLLLGGARNGESVCNNAGAGQILCCTGSSQSNTHFVDSGKCLSAAPQLAPMACPAGCYCPSPGFSTSITCDNMAVVRHVVIHLALFCSIFLSLSLSLSVFVFLVSFCF
jgi:hypothetical protein